ncbi:MAG: nuclear transport factor 2 family protein [Bacteroidota bacterium]
MKQSIFLFFILISVSLFAQKEVINYKLNEKFSMLASKNPFAKFIGEWTLKNDDWSQNWGGETQQIKIRKHHTVSTQINTSNSLLSIIDGPEPNGHIFWSYNPNTKEVSHLSSFGNIRVGQGKGTIDAEGNVQLKLSFEGEANGTYRIYKYTWITDDEYHMKSVQYDSDDKPTGLFYEGNFIRLHHNKKLRQEIEDILSVLDNYKISKEEQVKVYTDNVVHMAPNQNVHTNKEALLAYLKAQKKYGYADMKHKIIDYEVFGDVIIMQGKVVGKFYPNSGEAPVAFATKNLFVFKRTGKELKIAKVIYNMSPLE